MTSAIKPTMQPTDQARGLREAVSQQRHAPRTIPLPLISAHLPVCVEARVPVPPSGLVWHWHSGVRPAMGWDLQARLHVVGLPHQFRSAELNQWRSLMPSWHLVGGGLEMVAYADRLWLWLAQGTRLIPSLRKILEWLCRNQPETPIILAGLSPAPLERLTLWAQARYPLRCRSAEQVECEGAPSPQAFYRFLELCSALAENERDLRLGRLYE